MEFGEVYTALQQGTLDGMENPPDVIYKMKLHEVAKHYTITETLPSPPSSSSAALARRAAWGLQDAVARAGKETIAFADDAYTKPQDQSLEEMRKAITVTTFPADELQKMKELAQKGGGPHEEGPAARADLVQMLEEDVARFGAM